MCLVYFRGGTQGLPQQSLESVIFPLGGMVKSDVKDIAREIGLAEIADQKESMGICFIGKWLVG